MHRAGHGKTNTLTFLKLCIVLTCSILVTFLSSLFAVKVNFASLKTAYY